MYQPFCKSFWKNIFVFISHKYVHIKCSTPEVREKAYLSFVRPIAEYCSSVWDPHTTSQNKCIEHIQKKAIRVVTQNFDWKKTSSSKLLLERKWVTLETRRKISRLCLLFKT